jgi:threonyl-tRNA synthetase
MISITLPDGSVKIVENGSSGDDLARIISKTLQKDAVAVKVNGALKDLSLPLTDGDHVEIITRHTDEGSDIIRHDTAHVLAQAAKILFPDVQVTIGPSIEHGFYYDFYREKPFSTDDLAALEKKMQHIFEQDIAIQRYEWTRDETISFFKKHGERFKVELIEAIPNDQVVSVYQQGEFTDLCRGPHLPSTKRIRPFFKLTKVAGAYWRGDHNQPMLQRIYGIAFATEQQLKDHLYFLEEAEKRDHRRLGTELNLFHLQEEATGAVFWHPKGWTVYQQLQNFVRQRLKEHDYHEVNTPSMVDKSLWEASGHWEKFGEHMFVVKEEHGKELAIKPMNCPCHVQIFKQGIKSYRDLPLRMAEFGSCHRNEPSGALHGIMRVRAFTQDDAHIFCTPEQIISETKSFCDLLKDMYEALGMGEIIVKFSTRPEKRAGSDEVWDLAEHSLEEAAKAAGLNYTINPGEGAFYGPKLEFTLKDCLGRHWQCGTLQVDFVLPERLDAHYIGEDGKKHRPVMLHRAILGTFERFMGILIEHYAGKFPIWLAPVQAVISPITSEMNGYAEDIYQQLKKEGIRAELDIRNEKINYKIREHSRQKVPYILVVGKKEVEECSVSVRTLGSLEQQTLPFGDFVLKIKKEAAFPEKTAS